MIHYWQAYGEPAELFYGLSMLKKGVLNPAINSLLSRVRHTNYLVISDRGFPFWPDIETIDISLIDDKPQVLDVLEAILPNFEIGKAFMAKEFKRENDALTQGALSTVLGNVPITFEQHDTFKLRVPKAIGLIRTGDTTQYANIILESA